MTTLSSKNQEQQLIQRLMQAPLFAKMSNRHLQLLLKLAQSKQVDADDSLWLEGDRARGLYVLLRGEIELFAAGKQVDHCKPIQTLGEIALLAGQPHAEEAVCTTQCILLEIPAPVILHVLQRNSEICQRICRNVIGALSLRLQKANDEVGALGEDCNKLQQQIAEVEHHANDLNMIRRMRGD